MCFWGLTLGVLSPVWASTCKSVLAVGSSAESVEIGAIDEAALKNAPLHHGYYVKKVPALFPSTHLEPQFIDPEHDKSLVPQWSGTTDAPISMRETLIDVTTETGRHYTSFLDFQVNAADKGTVKTSTPGGTISLRWNEIWNGRDMSTNMGLYGPSLLDASLEENYNYPVSSKAKAVFLFLHGGGTSTTGHHVAAALSNSLGSKGVAVVSIDSLHHAYGPRENMSPTEYYNYLRDLRSKIAPPGVPVFVGGHSMGGEHADNLMRLTEKINSGGTFEGYISLSTPLDEAPGESMEAKSEAEEAVMARQDVQDMILPSEIDLNVTLFLQGKVAPLAGISTTMFSSVLDWTKPLHMGANWSPALYMMGRFDALYVGREKLFEEYVAGLTNTEVVIMDERIDINNNEVQIGHMIFDHRMPGSDKDLETSTTIRNFIGRVIGADLSKKFEFTNNDILSTVIVEYYTSLAFRIYLSEYSYRKEKATELVAKLNERKVIVSRRSGALRNQIKNETDPETKALLEAELKENEVEFAKLLSFLKKTYVPEGELETFAQENIERRKAVSDQINTLGKQKKTLSGELKRVSDELTALRKRVEAKSKKVLYGDLDGAPSNLLQARQELEEFAKNLVDFYKQIGEEDSAYAMSEIENDTFRVDPPEALKEKYPKLKAMLSEYLQMEKDALRLVMAIEMTYRPDSDYSARLFKIYGSVSALMSGDSDPEGLIGKEIDLKEAQASVMEEISRLDFIKQNLEHMYIQVFLSTYYNSEFTSGYVELNRPLVKLPSGDPQLQQLWGAWGGNNGIKKTREAEETTSLY